MATSTIEEAIRITVVHYAHDQLGWSAADCEERVAIESARLIPKNVFDSLARAGWNLKGARLLDVGAGQGGALLEALHRDADAYGIEPGNEFRTLTRMRLKDASFEPERVLEAAGQSMPFPDDHFDYIISLQVLEHVPDAGRVMREMFRVLKPGGQCYISCENYLSFREQHYRIPWLPMLPKPIGALYLRLIGRNPAFLRDYLYYSTYPQIWRMARRIGFRNLTYEEALGRFEDLSSIRRLPVRAAAMALRLFTKHVRQRFVRTVLHLNAFWRVGVRVRLAKPESI